MRNIHLTESNPPMFFDEFSEKMLKMMEEINEMANEE